LQTQNPAPALSTELTTEPISWEPDYYTADLTARVWRLDGCLAVEALDTADIDAELEWATERNSGRSHSINYDRLPPETTMNDRQACLDALMTEIPDLPEPSKIQRERDVQADLEARTCERCESVEATPCARHSSLYSTPKPSDPRLCQSCSAELVQSEMEAICSIREHY
jgi:hypothetical protein